MSEIFTYIVYAIAGLAGLHLAASIPGLMVKIAVSLTIFGVFFAESVLNRHLINSAQLPGWYRRSIADAAQSLVFAKIRFVNRYPTLCIPGYRIAQSHLGVS